MGLMDILNGMQNGPRGARQPAPTGSGRGSVLSGGLRNLIGDMEEKGHGDVAQSWVGRGENQPIGPNELGNALGAEDIDAVSQQTGMPREQILSELSQHLPEFVNQLTPDG